MKKWNKPLVPLLSLLAAAFASCENLEEEPPVNQGYKTEIRVPDPEDLTPEDSLLIQEQQQEFDKNKNNI